jgi:hypothetical protein
VGSLNISLAKVILEINGKLITVYTDANGAYSFLNIAGPANFKITVTKSGYSFASSSGFLLGDNTLNIVGSSKLYNIKVKVTDYNGLPLAGVRLIYGSRYGDTSSEGLMQFTSYYGSRYDIEVWKSNTDFLKTKINGQVFGDVTRAVVSLPPRP